MYVAKDKKDKEKGRIIPAPFLQMLLGRASAVAISRSASPELYVPRTAEPKHGLALSGVRQAQPNSPPVGSMPPAPCVPPLPGIEKSARLNKLKNSTPELCAELFFELPELAHREVHVVVPGLRNRFRLALPIRPVRRRRKDPAILHVATQFVSEARAESASPWDCRRRSLSGRAQGRGMVGHGPAVPKQGILVGPEVRQRLGRCSSRSVMRQRGADLAVPVRSALPSTGYQGSRPARSRCR